MKKKTYHALGLMSGTSLDGLDMALCQFSETSDGWKYKIIKTETLPYSDPWKEKLSKMHLLTAPAFWESHVEYGRLLGRMANTFIKSSDIKPQVVCSHGHTVFHQPEKGFTMQAGDGTSIAAQTDLPVVCDFRSLDVALGGQGAPLVPIGDKLLFPEYAACLNLGGFCNVSMEHGKQRIAYDICPANSILNRLANILGKTYDYDGQMARSGTVNKDLLHKLNFLPFYEKKPPKSLGREWLENTFLPILAETGGNNTDLMRTCVEHIGIQVGKALSKAGPGKVLVTGGGAHNSFMVQVIASYCKNEIYIPDKQTVDFKEALVFAFLGILRWNNRINVLSSVTGSKKDHSGGSVCFL